MTLGLAPDGLTAPERRWALAAAISSVVVFGLGVGEAIPLLSLLLEQRSTDPTLIGLNAGAAFLGVICGPLLVPRCLRAFGMRNFLLVCYTLAVVLFPLMHVFRGFAAWFVLRALLGFIGASVFTASEAWINLLAADATRGRIIGVYAAALSAGFAIGPLLLWATGLNGWAPFITRAALNALAVLPLLGVPEPARRFRYAHGGSPWRVAPRAPFILFAVAVFGVFETGLMALLPIWGTRLGFGDRRAAALVSVVYIGSIALQPWIGWLSDKAPRMAVLRLCAAVGMLGAGLIIVAAGAGAGVYALLFVWGGIAAGIYPVALGMAGDRFRSGDLIGMNAAITMAYGLGGLAGPVLGGAAMDLWNPQGLLAMFGLLFGGFLGASLIRGSR